MMLEKIEEATLKSNYYQQLILFKPFHVHIQ